MCYMRFAHLADCHLGGWREPKMRELNFRAFSKIIDEIILRKADFVVLSGDLFNTSLPDIDIIKRTVSELKRLRDAKIMVYAIAGSHDFSPSGKTMIDVLEKAELLVNVARGDVENHVLKLEFTVDKKTGAKLTGIPGRKGMLDKKLYSKLDYNKLEHEPGFKIFLFHTAISEYLPKNAYMDSLGISFLPRGFDYYAGGHVHSRFSENVKGYGRIVMPGPGFPNNFKELEELRFGGFWMVSASENINAEFVPVRLMDSLNIEIDCTNKSPEEVSSDIEKQLKQKLDDKIILIRIKGTLSVGRINDINFRHLYDLGYSNGAYYIMRNTSGVRIKELDRQEVQENDIEKIEDEIIQQNSSNMNIFADEKDFVKKLFNVLNKEQVSGSETKSAFEERVVSDFEHSTKLFN